MTESLRIGIVGVTGRLGSRLVQECARRGVPVVWQANSRSWTTPGSCKAELPTVIIDASRGSVITRTVETCGAAGVALVACASDLGPAGLAAAEDLARLVPVVHAVNLSVGHWLQRHLVMEAARIAGRLPDLPVASVAERHTAAKRDRPSGSAWSLADAWDLVNAVSVDEISSYRAGLPVSEHTVDLTFAHETLTIQHDVRDLGAAVFGTLVAAAWAHDAAPGFRSITKLFDELFLRETQ
jgi:4-hydroxy-tetrahydrodipicolinate reductase